MPQQNHRFFVVISSLKYTLQNVVFLSTIKANLLFCEHYGDCCLFTRLNRLPSPRFTCKISKNGPIIMNLKAYIPRTSFLCRHRKTRFIPRKVLFLLAIRFDLKDAEKFNLKPLLRYMGLLSQAPKSNGTRFLYSISRYYYLVFCWKAGKGIRPTWISR